MERLRAGLSRKSSDGADKVPPQIVSHWKADHNGQYCAYVWVRATEARAQRPVLPPRRRCSRARSPAEAGARAVSWTVARLPGVVRIDCR